MRARDEEDTGPEKSKSKGAPASLCQEGEGGAGLAAPGAPESGPGESGPEEAGEAAEGGEAGETAEAPEGGEAPEGAEAAEGAEAPEATEAPEGEGEPAEAVPAPALPPRVIVIDAAPYGVEPVVGQHVTRRMRATAAEMGYEVVEPAETIAAAQRLRMPYPPSPADLWRVTYVAQSRRGAFARVWAHQGRYVVEVSVASLDGTGPFFARGTAGAEDLHEVVGRLTREALPAVETWDAEAYAGVVRGQSATPQAVTQPTGPAPDGAPTESGEAGGVPTNPDPPQITRRRRDNRPTRRFDIALQVEGAIGTTSDNFFNFLAGARLGLRITNTIHLGLNLAYANLRGRDGRASNLLPMLQVENRIRLSSRTDITVPLRFGIGYLPFNGPVVRLAAGLNIPLSGRVELAFDILAPTFWVLPDRTAVSLDLAAEVIFRL